TAAAMPAAEVAAETPAPDTPAAAMPAAEVAAPAQKTRSRLRTLLKGAHGANGLRGGLSIRPAGRSHHVPSRLVPKLLFGKGLPAKLCFATVTPLHHTNAIEVWERAACETLFRPCTHTGAETEFRKNVFPNRSFGTSNQ